MFARSWSLLKDEEASLGDRLPLVSCSIDQNRLRNDVSPILEIHFGVLNCSLFPVSIVSGTGPLLIQGTLLLGSDNCSASVRTIDRLRAAVVLFRKSVTKEQAGWIFEKAESGSLRLGVADVKIFASIVTEDVSERTQYVLRLPKEIGFLTEQGQWKAAHVLGDLFATAET